MTKCFGGLRRPRLGVPLGRGAAFDALVCPVPLGAGSQISLIRPPRAPDFPVRTGGQLILVALNTLAREIAVHAVQPPEPGPDGAGFDVDVGAAVGAITLIGIPVTHVIDPLAARIGALISVMVVVVVIVIT
jgi:hypothetical protein